MKLELDIDNLAWDKVHNLIPVIVQDAKTQDVLMLGYMNREALLKTLSTKLVTFFSRSKNKLWTKGEISGNKLELVNIISDCDNDTLLISANPLGPICHIGMDTCFGNKQQTAWNFIQHLEATIYAREQSRSEDSYTAMLLNAGIHRVAQKVGEESVEVVIASVSKSDAELCGEVADLFFHLLVLLRVRNLGMSDVINVLIARAVG